ncbi:unnamed protein product [Brassica oleracea]|uniref:(rape) hypothetical protein n=2 Tax=Brassica TaxID=3705 RepID=A0A816IHH0_BRANA|nr:unnamed protein product [Brassica napus]
MLFSQTLRANSLVSFKELPTLTIPHGHLKSSNVVLDESFEPLLTDYALRPVMNSEQRRKRVKIGLSCCEEDEERRMETRDAVEKIERLRDGQDLDGDFATSTHNVFASRLMDDDDFGLAMNGG